MSATSQSANLPLMRAIPRYFEIALYLLVLTAFVTLASTNGLDMPSTLFVALALCVRGYVLITNRTLLIPERWTSGLTIAYVMFYVLDYFVLSQQFVSTTVHLVLFLTVMRLFSARRDRDHYLLAVVAFLMVLASAVLTVDSTFLFAFSIFMLCAIATFILMEMKRTSANATASALESGGDPNEHKLVISLAATAPVILGLILLAATAIFFVLPRLSNGYLNVFARKSELSTGFSDHVDLGKIGEIQQSSTVVMHVEIVGDKRDVYAQKWRGVSLSYFDGSSWSNPFHAYLVRPGINQQFDLRSRNTRFTSPLAVDLASQFHYHILMEPVGVNVFFLASQSQALQGKYRAIAMDRGGSVFNLDGERPIGLYDGWSLRDPAFAPPSDRVYAPEELSDYLRLPPMDPRIPVLANEVSKTSASDYEKAAAIERYLRTKFGYTLQLPQTPQKDPLAHFLFERKQGHCEYFASAMAVMLRTLRIPSRVITGFKSGEFNEVTSQYVVRGSDAHAWVEAYFPERGWVAFDPTPASSKYGSSGWNKLSMYSDAMASFWREWVINYDVSHQYNLSQQTAQGGRRLLFNAQRWGKVHYQTLLVRTRSMAARLSRKPTQWTVIAVAFVALLTALVNLGRIWYSVQRWMLVSQPDRAPQVAASLWYEKMVRKVERQGWQKSAAQTPSEFACSIKDEKLRHRVTEFTRRYEGARFGDSVEDARQLPELYEEVVSSPR